MVTEVPVQLGLAAAAGLASESMMTGAVHAAAPAAALALIMSRRLRPLRAPCCSSSAIAELLSSVPPPALWRHCPGTTTTIGRSHHLLAPNHRCPIDRP